MMKMEREPFGTTKDGKKAELFTLTNNHGMEVKISDYGGTIVSLVVPDKNGQPGDIVLGFDTLDEYMSEKNPFFGCLVGRYANRIGGGKFSLNGVEYILAKNDGPNHLHGGLKGFDKVVWKAQAYDTGGVAGVLLHYESPDGEEGYPGNLSAEVRYTLMDSNELRIRYKATTDKPTIVNLTNHTYFNLAGQGDVLDHEIKINASYITPVDENLIPTGELMSLEGTPFYFHQPMRIGARIDDDHPQSKVGGGYDHNFRLNKPLGGLTFAANVSEPTSGRTIEMFTTQMGVQFYTGNMMPPATEGKGGQVYPRRGGFCLETQTFPDSPNKPDFPSPILRPGETYDHLTVFKFGTV